jgi:hypothetical protein
MRSGGAMSKKEHDPLQPERDWSSASNVAQHLEEITAHIEKHIGKIGIVLDEIESQLVHLDILQVPATADRPYQVLVTSGVSDLPMLVPDGMEKYARAELLIALPKEWPISKEAFADEANWWPIRWLKTVGRLPHANKTSIGWGHTVPNGDPPQAIANTGFVGVMLSAPYFLSHDFFQLRARSGDVITFYTLIPLYLEEMNLKLTTSAQELEERLDNQDIRFVLDTKRPNVGRKKGWFR